jgi:hypothetical protein
MTQPLIGRKTRVEVEKTLGAAVTISAITIASPPVVTYTGTADIDNGDVIIISDDIEGMQELSGQVARVANLDQLANTFELEKVDASDYGALTGTTTFQKVTEWVTLGKARNVTAGGASPNTLDGTVLLDRQERKVFAQNPAPDITIDSLSDLLSEGAEIIDEAAENNDPLAFRITMNDGQRRIFRGNVTLPSENIPLKDLVTTTMSVSQIGKRFAFAS